MTQSYLNMSFLKLTFQPILCFGTTHATSYPHWFNSNNYLSVLQGVYMFSFAVTQGGEGLDDTVYNSII